MSEAARLELQIRNAIESADLPDSVDLGKLSRGVRDAIEEYRKEHEPAHETNEAIKTLCWLARNVSDGKTKYVKRLAGRFRLLPKGALYWLKWRASCTRKKLPTVAQIENPRMARVAAARILFLTQSGAHWKQGRLRPGGKRSRHASEPHLHVPHVPRHRTTREANNTLVMWLRVAWLEATGQKAPSSADPRKLGPFPRLVHAALKILEPDAAPDKLMGVAAELVNRAGQEQKKNEDEKRKERWAKRTAVGEENGGGR